MLSIRNFFPKTLLARFMLIIIIPTIISQLLAIFLFYDRHWYNVSYYTSSIIIKEINSLLHEFDEAEILPSKEPQDYLNLQYQFIDKDFSSIKQPKLNEELEIFKGILDSKIVLKKIIRLSPEGKIEILFKYNDKNLKMFFPSKLLMNPTAYIFILWLIFLTVTLLAVSLIFCKKQINSILELTTAADKFGKGLNTTIDYKPRGAREIRRAGIALLRMKERIERQIIKRTQMLAMISHDLRTPLTRIKLQLELMPDSEDVSELKSDVKSMEQMINSYLDFARGEGGEDFEILPISSWLRKLLTSKWPAQKFMISTQEDAINIQIKPLSFERAITNVINNAIKYSTKIKVSIYLEQLSAVIVIEDDGPGIKDSEKALVFKPFYRSDESRSLDKSSNIGLGLAITKEIVAGHYGTISLEDSKDLGGLKVRIDLPLL
jgi:two-component system osmolarity sensor histidine kinase EnvZ